MDEIRLMSEDLQYWRLSVTDKEFYLYLWHDVIFNRDCCFAWNEI